MALLTRCVCGSSVGELITWVDIVAVKCACGVARLHTTITQEQHERGYRSGEYHRSAVRHPGCTPYHQRYEHDLEIARIRVQRYTEILGSKRINDVIIALDVGAANGAFVDYLAKRGVYAWGLEPSSDFSGDRIIQGTTQDVEHRGLCMTNDLITYHDVLEHLVDPDIEIKRAARLLGMRGLLIVDVPDVWTSAGGDHHWKHEHLWYFTQNSLVMMAAEAGLRMLAIDRPIPGKQVLYAERIE